VSGERAALVSMLMGYFPAQALYTAVHLGIAEQLAGRPMTADELAAAIGCDPGAMRRLLHALTVIGVAEQPQPEVFALTGTGDLLRADHPSSVRNYAMLFCGQQVWRAWGDLEYSVRTGKSSWERHYGPRFSEESVDLEFSDVFNAAMAEGAGRAAPAVIAAGRFGRFATVADLGGGRGTLLAAILTAHPGLRGILFDLPEALEGAAAVLGAAGVSDRCAIVAGDFFREVPGGADAYLLKSVIHDWDDERAVSILAHCRQVMPDAGTLLLVEPVAGLRPDHGDEFSLAYSDLNMLVCTSGRERTEEEFQRLLTAAGFTCQHIVPCPRSGYSIIEGTPLPLPAPLVQQRQFHRTACYRQPPALGGSRRRPRISGKYARRRSS
jgi:orsellinic acid C2-O-methyltransferase